METKKEATAKVKTVEKQTKQEPEKVYAVGFKGFGPGMVCRGKQYAENTVFEESEAELCKKGIHFCEKPLDVLNYYPLICDDGKLNEFATVEALAEPKTDGQKSVTTKLRIGAKLDLAGFIRASVDFVLSKIDKKKNQQVMASAATNTGDYSAATNTGNRSAATNTGDYSAATNTGNRSAATNTGFQSAATNTGFQSAATNTGNRSAATNTGFQSAATNTGFQSAASVGGKESFAVATGINGKVKGAMGCFLACAEWEEGADGWHPVAFVSGKVDGEAIKADTWYTVKNGKFVEVNE